MKVTENFTNKELGIDNVFDSAVIINMCMLTHRILQPLRDKLRMPLTINSGYRTLEHNTKIGGARNSQHMKGQAVDFTCYDLNMAYTILETMEFDQLIWYRNFIHISYNLGKNRNQIIIKSRKEV